MLYLNNKNKYFKFCLDLYVIRDKNCFGHCCSDGNSLIPKIKIAKEAGYSGIELWHKDIIKFISDVGPIEQLKEEIEKLGLVIPSYKVMEEWDDYNTLKFASILGAKSCVVKLVSDTFNGEKPSLHEMKRRYEHLLFKAEPYNIKPSLEFMSLAKCYNNINDAIDIIESVNHSQKSIVLDTWHLWRNDDKDFSNCPFERINPKNISVVHYTDACKDIPRNQQTDGDRRMPNQGILNLKKFSNKLTNIGFNGWLSLNVYDKSLWNENSLKVASRGLFSMKETCQSSISSNLSDNNYWDDKQTLRCDGLWTKSYWSHLDPRIEMSNREEKLLEILRDKIEKKIVLDFKCGFSPLANYVTYGFDAFQGCIDYLKDKYKNKFWYCKSDLDFSNYFNEKIDVLLHIGLGDSITEINSHLAIRKKCKPELIIIEAAANDKNEVDESKIGNQKNWEILKNGLIGETYILQTNMKERSKRILFVGKNNDQV
jgi:sugar phosphate isomerase/epimerase